MISQGIKYEEESFSLSYLGASEVLMDLRHAAIGEQLMCSRELNNLRDRSDDAIIKMRLSSEFLMDLWHAAIGEQLMCSRELNNLRDRSDDAIIKMRLSSGIFQERFPNFVHFS